MGNSQGNKRGKRPQDAHKVGLNEPLKTASEPLPQKGNEGLTPPTNSSIITIERCPWDPGTTPVSSRPNSLELAIQDAFRNLNSESDLDPKFLHSVERLGGGNALWGSSSLDQSFDMSELPGGDE